MKPALLSFLFAVGLSAQPLSERPASSPVNGPAAHDQSAPAIASDGTDFIAVWSDSRSLASSIYATRMTRSGDILDRTGIRIAGPSNGSTYEAVNGVFWAGGAYVVLHVTTTWGESGQLTSLNMTRIARDGQILDGPRAIRSGIRGVMSRAACNGSRIVLAYGDGAGVRLLTLDAFGTVVRDTPVPAPATSWGWTVSTNGSEFLVTWNSYTKGNAFGFAGIDATGEFTGAVHSISASVIGDPTIASDGNDFIAIYFDAQEPNTHVQRFSREGRPLDAVVFASPSFATFEISNAIWTGDSYLIVGTDMRDTNQNLAALRLSRTGTPISTLSALLDESTPGVVNVPALAWNGSEIALAAATGRQSDVSGFDVFAVILDRSGSPQTPSQRMESGNEQTWPSTATNGMMDVVAWTEADGIFAARLPRYGSALDGRGIRITEEAHWYPSVVYDARTSTFVIAWGTADGVKARRLDATTGEPGNPFVIQPCRGGFDIAGGDGVIAAVTSCDQKGLAVMRISDTNSVAASVTLATARDWVTGIHLARNGRTTLVTWTELQRDYSIPIDEPMFRGTVYAARVMPDLRPLDPQPIGIAVTESMDDEGALAASDGTDFVVVWQRIRGTVPWNQIHIRYVGADGTLRNGTASDPGEILVPGYGSLACLVWDGVHYTIAYKDALSYPLSTLYLTHAGRTPDAIPHDRIQVGVENLAADGASLVSRGNGSVAASYARIALEPQVSGVSRIFHAEPASPRIRAISRR